MKTTLGILALLVAVSSWSDAATNDLTSALQKGLFEEEANHNLPAAIQAYQSVIGRFDQDRKLAATAVFRLGECYRKQGNTNEALIQYERVVREFGDQSPLVTLSRSYLASAGQTVRPEAAAVSGPATSVEAEEVRRIQAMIKDSPDLINAKNNGLTPLHQAASQGQLVVARFLLDSGADVDAKSSQSGRGNETPLFYAAMNGHRTMVELLLDRRANVNARDGSDRTPLLLAVQKGFKNIVEILLARGAEVNARNQDGSSALHLVAGAGFKAIAELLLAHGADANAANVNGSTPLHLVNDVATADLLVVHNANVNALNREGRTPLSLAASAGNVPLAKVLLAKGAEVETKTSDGLTPLVFAVAFKQKEMVEVLLKAKADPNVRFDFDQYRWRGGAPQNPNVLKDYTPLLFAVREGSVEIAQALLNAKADPNLRSATGDVAILNAVALGDNAPSRELVAMLLKHGADPNAAREDGWTALHTEAGANGSKEIAELLLKGGANPNARYHDGSTPLHIAIRSGNRNAVELLLANKADPNARDDAGNTPLDLTKPQQPMRIPAPAVPSAPVPSRGVRVPPGVSEPPTSIAALLREHGAMEDAPHPDVIEIRRPSTKFSTVVARKGTQDWKSFSLLDVLSIRFGFLSVDANGGNRSVRSPYSGFANGTGIDFPDLTRVRIRRPGADLKSWSERTVDLATALISGSCSNNLLLAWGDVVEVLEAEHPLNEKWSGLSSEELAGLKKCLARDIEVAVKGHPEKITLTPDIKTDPGTPAEVYDNKSFMIGPVLFNSKLLLASSDLSRIKVTRRDPATGQKREWIVDCSGGKPAPDLWLCDGDRIEVPERDN